MATIKERIDNVTENVTDGKVEISSAITEKGVSTSNNATFSTMANNIRAIETGAKDRIQNEADSSYVYVKSDDTIEAYCSDCNISASSYVYLNGEVGTLSMGDVTEFDGSSVHFLQGLHSYEDTYLCNNGGKSHIGNSILCNNIYETGIGKYNISKTGVDSASTIFTVGNGTSSSNRSNVMEVRNNGDLYLGDSTGSTYIKIQKMNDDISGGFIEICSNNTLGFVIKGGDGSAIYTDLLQLYGKTSRYHTNLNVQGNIIATGTITPGSDKNLKENIRPLEDNTLNKVLQLKPTRFTLRNDETKKEQIGFIAQEVEEVFPEFVVTSSDKDKEETKYLDYMKLTSILCKAIQEQQKKIEELEAKIS